MAVDFSFTMHENTILGERMGPILGVKYHPFELKLGMLVGLGISDI